MFALLIDRMLRGAAFPDPAHLLRVGIASMADWRAGDWGAAPDWGDELIPPGMPPTGACAEARRVLAGRVADLGFVGVTVESFVDDGATQVADRIQRMRVRGRHEATGLETEAVVCIRVSRNGMVQLIREE